MDPRNKSSVNLIAADAGKKKSWFPKASGLWRVQGRALAFLSQQPLASRARYRSTPRSCWITSSTGRCWPCSAAMTASATAASGHNANAGRRPVMPDSAATPRLPTIAPHHRLGRRMCMHQHPRHADQHRDGGRDGGDQQARRPVAQQQDGQPTIHHAGRRHMPAGAAEHRGAEIVPDHQRAGFPAAASPGTPAPTATSHASSPRHQPITPSTMAVAIATGSTTAWSAKSVTNLMQHCPPRHRNGRVAGVEAGVGPGTVLSSIADATSLEPTR